MYWSDAAFKDWHLEYTYDEIFRLFYNRSTLPSFSIELPATDAAVQNEDMLRAYNFYFLDSINIEDIDTTRHELEVGESYLQSLATRELMNDCYHAHDTLRPSYLYPYNQRINLANVNRQLYDGYYAQSMFQYKEDTHTVNLDQSSGMLTITKK